MTPEGYRDMHAKAVIIATGGFESNREMRTRYLGPAWSFLRPRGTRYNQGLGLKMALDIGAQASGHWSGAHCAPMDWHLITETPEGTILPVPSDKHWWNAGLFNSRLAYFVAPVTGAPPQPPSACPRRPRRLVPPLRRRRRRARQAKRPWSRRWCRSCRAPR